MDSYVTGAAIRALRSSRGLTQSTLAEKLAVSDKAVSKWETGRGLPDISLLEPLAAALGISVAELFSGSAVTNRNKSANMKRSRFYVCPVCGNVISSAGEAVVCCCGVTLPLLEAEEPDEEHPVRVEIVEDEYYVTLDHPMTRQHFISFLASVSDERVELVKLYPEQDAAARFKLRDTDTLYVCCNRHGLFRIKL